jgi:hypothetical protein
MVRTTFDHNATVVLNAFMRGGAQWLDDFYGTVRGQALKGGSLTAFWGRFFENGHDTHVFTLTPVPVAPAA